MTDILSRAEVEERLAACDKVITQLGAVQWEPGLTHRGRVALENARRERQALLTIRQLGELLGAFVNRYIPTRSWFDCETQEQRFAFLDEQEGKEKKMDEARAWLDPKCT